MARRFGRVFLLQTLLVLLVGVAACNKNKSSEQASQGNGTPAGPPPNMPGGPGRPHGPIGEAMTKLAKGPQSLNARIGKELKSEPPPWEQIQPQTKEFAQLSASLGQYDQPKGDKESWQKQTAAFAKTASDLEHAAEAKNKADALAAHQMLQTSCKACHDAHRGGPGGPPRPQQ